MIDYSAMEQKEITDIYNQAAKLLKQILQEEDMSRASSAMSGRTSKNTTPINAADDRWEQKNS